MVSYVTRRRMSLRTDRGIWWWVSRGVLARDWRRMAVDHPIWSHLGRVVEHSRRCIIRTMRIVGRGINYRRWVFRMSVSWPPMMWLWEAGLLRRGGRRMRRTMRRRVWRV